MTDQALPTGTIDITNIVEGLRETFVEWAVLYVYGAEIAIPGMEWVALPIISTIDQAIIRHVVDPLSKSAIMIAFFQNTAIRKAGQAEDFVAALNAKNSLPPTATDDDYERAERAQMLAFRNFVSVTN